MSSADDETATSILPPKLDVASDSRFPPAVTVPPPVSLPPVARVPKLPPTAVAAPTATAQEHGDKVTPNAVAKPISAQEQGDSRATFEAQFAEEILDAERFRAKLLAAIPTVTLFALVVVRGAYPDVVIGILHGNIDLAPVGFFLLSVAIFQMLVLAWLRRLHGRGETPPAIWRYTQALVETSLPTAVVLYYAFIDGPVQALLMPAVFLYFVFILLSTLRLDFVLCAFTGFVAAAEYAGIALVWGASDLSVSPMLRSSPHHVGKAAILLVSGVTAGFVAQRLRRSFMRAIESLGERQRILGVFGQHVSPEVVGRLVAHKTEVASELRDVCVMFVDIRNFTAFTEKRTAAEVVDYLNTIFDATLDAVVSRQGIVNKYLGDGFMAVFGAPIADPNAESAAVDAALDIVAKIDALIAEQKIPHTRVGIGLHAGKAVVGNIGSAKRKEYTVIGDVVNVASRLESLNKELGSSVLVSEEVWSACHRTDIDAIARDAVHVRGRVEPVRVWQLV